MSGARAGEVDRRHVHVPDFLDVARKAGEGLGFVFGSARILGVALVSAGMIMLLLRSMLYVRTGWGAEDFLGWADESPSGPAVALLELWRHCQLLWLARLYMALDSIAFVPIYAAFFLKTGWVLARALDDDTGRPAPAGRRWFAVFWVPVLMLVAVDLVENLAGLQRTGGYGPLIGGAALALGVAGVWRLASLGVWKIPAHRGALIAGLLLLAALLAGMFFWADACAAVEGATWRGRLGCAAHRSKSWLVVAVLGVLAAGGVCWLFGAVLSTHADVAGNPERALRRADLRAAIFDCLVRSRYVLAALALLAALTVVMDQSRDIIASTSSFVPRFFTMIRVDWGGTPPPAPGTPIDWLGVLWLLAGSLTVFALSILGLALLVFACWLWTRSVCHLRSAGRRPAIVGFEAAHDGDRHEDIFARDWARVLALVPVLLVVLLCANVLEDIAKAQTGVGTHGAGAGWLACLLPSAGVVAFAVLAVFAGGGFVWRRGDRASTGGYYDCIDWTEWSTRAGLMEARPHASAAPGTWGTRPADLKYNFLGKVTPYLLPMAALGLVFLCRLVDVLPGRTGDYFPSMAFPVILLSLTFWLCFFGWLSLLEVYGAVPWVLVLFVWIGVLGLAGLTDNHIVWSGPLAGEPSAWGGIRMLACSAVLAGVIVVAYRWAMERVRHPGSGASLKVYWPLVLVVPAMTVAIMVVGNQFATARRPQAEPGLMPSAAPAAVPLDTAMAGWLRILCHAADDASPCTPQLAPRPGSGGYDVYFVSSEGGGIRAAMWTALVLRQLETEDASFDQRTFSISGVSGGAVGAAVYRACSGGAELPEACIRRFAQTDLLSPLLSSWMFEDLLGRLVPSGLCRTPGCGFMTRGAWFEQAMEVGAPRLRRGMRELRGIDTAGANADRHVPYLLLNATWVETGERAIATELAVSQADFPGSKDQLGLAGSDMPLGAAAHNAARFPYVNAIGGLKTPAFLCDNRGPAAPSVPGKNPGDAKIKICGHLADGGYFDNGGAQSTTDLVRAFVACLAARDDKADRTTACGKLPETQRTWLRENLVPRVLMIRNESDPRAAAEERCGETSRPGRADVIPAIDNACITPIGKRYQPARPLCARGKVPYLDFIGPLLAVVNTSGVGAAGRLAEAREADAIVQARIAMRGKAAAAATEAVTAIDLLPQGVHFPLGWHLSRSGVDNMSGQAAHCRILPVAGKP